MKLFEQIQQVERPEPQKAEVDSSEFVKRNLMKSVDRSPEIRDAVEKWLFSFKGGITKDAFMWQMKRLDYDDSIAFAQLERAVGRRTIPLPPPPKKPLVSPACAPARRYFPFSFKQTPPCPA